MKKSTFKVLFLIRRNQVNKEGKCAIMIKVTVDGEYERINSTLTIEPELWDASASKAIGRSSKIAEFNKRIEDMWKSRCRLTPVGGKKLTPSSKKD